MIVRSELLGPGKVEVVVALTLLLLLTYLHPQTGAFDRIISCIEISKIAACLHSYTLPQYCMHTKEKKASTCPGRPLPLLHPSPLFKLLIDVLLLCRSGRRETTKAAR